ncbi:phage tail protein [Anaerosinus massiliensis]|uniref:phage tail protein n=1 Tax=Massilibacillus massiliensis TaxID=1806837 RepID=UPI000AE38206|nr:phage tail protein [Massilibacillus massiliensis]
MSYNSDLPEDIDIKVSREDIRENLRALKEDKIVDAATAVVAETADKLTTARKISLEGDATGSTSFDGSKDVAIQVDVLSADNANTIEGKTVNDIISACSIYAVPTGAVEYFARKIAPEGWLKADGSAVSRTVYANLFTAVGTIFGAGDGSTTFNLPDLRGEFVRGFDDGREVDTGRLFGSAQKGSLSVNDPSLSQLTITSFISADDTTNVIMNQRVGLDNPVSISEYDGLNNALYNPATSYQSVIENPFKYNFGITRPRNVALLACIKY